MAFTADDIKIKASQRMSDFEDGGGFMTSEVIVSGAANNIFDDVSRVDRSSGETSLRQIFPHIDSDNDDRGLDAHLVIAAPPADGNVHLCALAFSDKAASRAEARTYLESYSDKSAVTPIVADFGAELPGGGGFAIEESVPAGDDVLYIDDTATITPGRVYRIVESPGTTGAYFVPDEVTTGFKLLEQVPYNPYNDFGKTGDINSPVETADTTMTVGAVAASDMVEGNAYIVRSRQGASVAHAFEVTNITGTTVTFTPAAPVDFHGDTHRIYKTTETAALKVSLISPLSQNTYSPDVGEIQEIDVDTEAVRLYGVHTLAVAASATDTVLEVGSLYARMAPSTYGDPKIIGIDQTQTAPLGQLLSLKPTDLVVIHSTKQDTLSNPLSSDDVETLTRTNLSAVWLVDADGLTVPVDGVYVADLAAGTLTFDSALDLTGFTEPLVAHHRIENMRTVQSVDTETKEITIDEGVSVAFDTDSYISAALYLGNQQARYTNLFDQKVWNDEFLSTVDGDTATATYDDATYPIEVTNAGCGTHEWALVFTSATDYKIINEDRGILTTGSTLTDLTLTNNLTGEAYFVIRAAGWGAGWITNNVLRFKTIAAAPPVWLCRVTDPGAATATNDQGVFEYRVDADQ